jgi:iron complex transport system substrate-binding protein
LHRTSRRLTGGILALGLAASVRACGTDAATDTAAAESGWEFTDDLGTTIALDEVPTPAWPA